MVFRDKSSLIFVCFYQTYVRSRGRGGGPGNLSLNSEWSKFIETLDIGVQYIRSESLTRNGTDDIYKIVDEKKWLFAKIKHGLWL